MQFSTNERGFGFYMKKLISVLLIVCFVLPLTVACSEKTQPGDTNVKTDPAVSIDSPEIGPTATTEYPDIPEMLDYDSYDFTILSCLASSIVFNDFSVENADYDVVNEAIFKRNSDAENKFNIVIVSKELNGNVFSEGVGTGALRQDYTAGEALYDLCGLSTWQAASCAANGYLLDLNEIPYINLGRSWWDQRTNVDLAIQGKMFFTTGDIGVTDNLGTHCILFSKGLAAEKNITDIYELVLNDKWTWDKLEEYTRTVSEDLNGDDVMDEYDRFGLLCWNSSFQASFGAARAKIADINSATGDLSLTIYSDRNTSLAARICNLCFDSKYSINSQSTLYSDRVKAVGGLIGMFANGQGLFAAVIFRDVPKLRDMEMDFGIIPYPMFDETQGEYGGYVSATYSNMYGIELNAQDLERTGVITEYLAYVSQQYVTPAYYEHTLKGRDARDEESIRCLEIIFANRSFDAGVFYEIGGYTSNLTDMMKMLYNNFETIYKVSRKKAQTEIDKINEQYKAQGTSY